MAAVVGPLTAAPAASTGNNSHAAVQVNEVPHALALVFNVEAIGATPTVTFKLQGTLDGTNWFDLFLLPANSDTAVASSTVTAVGQSVLYLERAERIVNQVRLVTSANTNVTYNGSVYVTVGS